MAFAPIYFLAALAAALVVVVAASVFSNASRRRNASASATAAGLRHTPVDRFNLASRLAPHCALAAADVRVNDLTYGPRVRDTVYVATVSYTTGTLRGTRRRTAAFVLTDSAGETAVREVDPKSPLAEVLNPQA